MSQCGRYFVLTRPSLASIRVRFIKPLLEPLESRRLLAAEAVWIEGEDFVSSTFNQDPAYQRTRIDRSQLSPGVPGSDTLGDWHTHRANSPSTAVAHYN